ncbi:MAG: hypothetical protein V4819_09330 [Verrucomicrobiota bacterium]
MPEVLEIAAMVQEGLSLRVTYVPVTGAHASVPDLNYLVEDINADFQRVTADPAAGNLIGPFTAGQILRVRTDVGNSCDHSELSAEQVVTIAPAPQLNSPGRQPSPPPIRLPFPCILPTARHSVMPKTYLPLFLITVHC